MFTGISLKLISCLGKFSVYLNIFVPRYLTCKIYNLWQLFTLCRKLTLQDHCGWLSSKILTDLVWEFWQEVSVYVYYKCCIALYINTQHNSGYKNPKHWFRPQNMFFSHYISFNSKLPHKRSYWNLFIVDKVYWKLFVLKALEPLEFIQLTLWKLECKTKGQLGHMLENWCTGTVLIAFSRLDVCMYIFDNSTVLLIHTIYIFFLNIHSLFSYCLPFVKMCWHMLRPSLENRFTSFNFIFHNTVNFCM